MNTFTLARIPSVLLALRRAILALSGWRVILGTTAIGVVAIAFDAYREAPPPRVIKVHPLENRGTLLDARGTPLTAREVRAQLYVNMNAVRRFRHQATAMSFADALAAELDISPRLVRAITNRWSGVSRIKNLLLTEREVNALRAWFARSPWAKHRNLLQFDWQPWVIYPEGSAMSQVIGLVNVDGDGQEGMQLSVDELLRSGANVQLSIDLRRQKAVEQALKEAAHALRADDAMATVIQLPDQRVVALASFPTNDPNYRPGIRPEWQRLRPVTDVFQAGPMLQPFLLAGAFENHVGSLPDLEHAFVTGRSEAGVAMARALGLNEAVRTLRWYGLDRPTGIDFPSEARTFCCGGGAEATQLVEIGEGHAVADSLVRYARSFATLVNGGPQSEMKLVTRIIYPDGRVETPASPINGAEVYAKTAAYSRRQLVQRARALTGDPDADFGGLWATYQEKLREGVNRVLSAALFAPAYVPKYLVVVKVGLREEHVDADVGLRLGLAILGAFVDDKPLDRTTIMERIQWK